MAKWTTGKLKPTKLFMAAVAVVLVGAGFYLWWSSNPDSTRTGLAVLPGDADNNQPDETKPDDNYQWQGGPNDPKYISLPTIGAEGYIQNVGVDQNQEVAVPSNIHIAGWFVDSVLPGQTGLSIIDGHVDGIREDGIFKQLAKLKKGDEYTIEMGNGDILRYKVMDVVSTTTKEAANILFSQDPSVESQLNLITCGGNFDQQSRQYEERVVTSSVLVR